MAKILVIEDAEPLRNDIVEMLTFEGFDVVDAENGVVGVAMARQHRPDLIVCDIMMPELDGYGVLDAVRNDQGMLTVPFIFLTAKTDRTDIRHGMGLGADDYLTKPFVASELLETIHARLDKKQALNQELESRLQDLSNNIITALPHELRTPLNTIIGFSDMLIAEAANIEAEQVVVWAEHIHSAGERLYRLIENYLVYVQAEVAARNLAALAEINQQFVEHPESVVEFHTVYTMQRAERENDLKLDLKPGDSIRISDYHLGKIIEEILGNALKFSGQGFSIDVTAAPSKNGYLITIEDHGRGMTRDQIDSIGTYMQFDRWFYEQQGSGFGLALVRRLVTLYDGTFSLESVPEKGTKVSLEFRKALKY